MKRLTFEGKFCDIAKCQDVSGGSFCEDGYCSQRRVWERLKEYEDAEEAGRIFVAPVAIGQTIWRLYRDFPQFYPETNGWDIGQGKITQVSTVGFQFRDELECDSDWILYDEIGDGYYLTEAEVQAAFKAAVEHDC